MALRVFRFCLALIVLTPMGGCASYEPQYSAKSIEAWVVDADTNEAIEGVVVVANWEILAGAMSARSKIIQLKILESITDREGAVLFSSMGTGTESVGDWLHGVWPSNLAVQERIQECNFA
jgi:hypothetical protein